ncbi:suppressor protein STP22 of temperature-sensitive alpha-factor receptor and arginine permease [Aplysia californica]|uniref:Suppressor protein STP22 of temperature-sensitive alpha-factor receptor and arginine permease n=1 Tax=Aplysia californica TaxID=6500 RepID=A0ABM0K3N7_APLCA|nr:suppressor protein STP22 of temperature-sensitive alpha-factor receptor and arginine permease [Aplysia californica]
MAATSTDLKALQRSVERNSTVLETVLKKIQDLHNESLKTSYRLSSLESVVTNLADRTTPQRGTPSSNPGTPSPTPGTPSSTPDTRPPVPPPRPPPRLPPRPPSRGGMSESVVKKEILAEIQRMSQDVKSCVLKGVSDFLDAETEVMTQLADTKHELSSKIDKLADTKHELSSKIDKLADTKHELSSKIDKLADTKHELSSQIDTLADTKHELSSKIDKLADTKHELSSKIDTLADTKHELSSKIVTLADTKHKLSSKIDTLAEEVSRSRAVAERCEGSVSRLVRITVFSYTKLQQEVGRVSASLGHARASLDQLCHASKQQQHTLGEISQDLGTGGRAMELLRSDSRGVIDQLVAEGR